MRTSKSICSLLAMSWVLLAQPVVAASFPEMVKAGQINGLKLIKPTDVEKFYLERDFSPVWVNGNRYSAEARALISEIENSWTHGLNPENYHLTQLKALGTQNLDGDRAFEAEIILTDAVARLGKDLTGIRMNPQTLEQDLSSWSRGISVYSLLTIAAQKSDPAEFIERLSPQDEEYESLRGELKRIVTENFSPIPRYTFPGLIKPGQRNEMVSVIRARLDVSLSNRTDENLYDEDLVEAVTQKQTMSGLTPDGLIGKRTFKAIFESHDARLVKILANLERRRWVMRPMPSRYIAVNVPEMKLRAYESGQLDFEIPVIVGRAERPTFSFVDDIIGVRFNPSWYVPDTIKAEDYLPALQADPHALDKKGITFRVKTEEGFAETAATDIDWANVTPEQLKLIQMKQGPGEENVLGKIRVLMPNRYDIYLHDTSNPELFAKDDRALSSGCVRLSEPRKIANFVLGVNPTWSNDRLETYLSKDKTLEVPTVKPLPVYLFYFTSWLNEDKKLVVTDDLYGHDAALVKVLQDHEKIPFSINWALIDFPKKTK